MARLFRAVELGIMPENPLLVEGQAARGGEIAGDVRPLSYRSMQRQEGGIFGLAFGHGLRKGIGQAFDHLEE
ncbi:hypothetical protein RHECNPAF_1260030 [Rhizobium etli CNPAF512]|nr:hypothetical protein RHECNPAF_1260030 [Rhizobium etli CNPAF512]